MAKAFEPTPEQAATIIDIAERVLARRGRQGRTGASVTQNDWSKEEAVINGARNDLKSATYRLEKATAALDHAQGEYDKAVRAVENRTKRLNELLGG